VKNTAAAADMPEEPAAPQQGQGGAATGPLANYEIQRRIGSGKFSVVYKARKLKDNSVCALKKVQVFDIKDAKVCTAASALQLSALLAAVRFVLASVSD
jgi:serine/threonine protein kinase